MMLTGKVWGNTRLLFGTPLVEAHLLSVKPNAQCSMHCHEFKWNAFVVLSGELTIEVRKKKYKLTDETVLRAGESTAVRPGEFHRFRSGSRPVTAIEVYYPESLSEDIVRKDVGSVKPSSKAARR